MNRKHPVRQLLDAAAMGHLPHDHELDEVAKLVGKDRAARASLRRVLKRAAESAVESRREGQFKAARDIARNTSEQLDALLPEYVAPPRELPDDPRALADLVRRRF